jgi:hypothetical protein
VTSVPDLNDTATATLVVDPFGPSTDAELEVFRPDGTSSEPSTASTDGGQTWTATLVYDQAGWWLLTWTVTGTGAGVQHQRVYVPPAPATGGAPIYASRELLKEMLKITDSDRDSLLDQALIASCRSIDDLCGRRFYLDNTVSARTYNPRGRVTPDGLLLVDDIGSASGLVVEVGAGSTYTTLASDTYELYPDNALARGEPVTGLQLLSGCWPKDPKRARVTSRWGFPTIPDVVTQASLLQASRLFSRRNSPEGVMGNAEWGVIRVSRVDPDVWALVSRYVIPGIG